MKTILLFSAFGRFPMLEYELDIAQRHLDDGDHVVFLSCDGITQNICPANNPRIGGFSATPFRQRYCVECKSRVSSGMEWLQAGLGKLTVRPFEELSQSDEKRLNELTDGLSRSMNQASMKSHCDVDDIDIYDAAISQLASELKTSSPNLVEHWDRFIAYVQTGWVSYFSAMEQLAAWTPDAVYVYNGRMVRYRPIMRVSQRRNELLTIYEYPDDGFNKYVLNRGQYNHDRMLWSKSLFEKYRRSGPINLEQESEVYEWFDKRTKGQLKNREAHHVAEQVPNDMPKWWRSKEFNIVVFVSTVYEWVGCREDEEGTYYSSQADGLRRIIADLPEQVVVTVRLHPNMAGADEKEREELLTLANDNSVRVVDAAASIDSYSLMREADIVMTFGSTTGIEAAFLGKPVVSIGGSLYMAFNATLSPVNHTGLMLAIQKGIEGDFSDFPNTAQRTEMAIAFAWHFVNYGTIPRYLHRKTYWGGAMSRNGIQTVIRAAPYIRYYNAAIDSITKSITSFSKRVRRVYFGIHLLCSDAEKRSKFVTAPGNVLINYFWR